MSDDRRIDAHVHFWDPEQRHHDWLDAVPQLRRPYLPAQLAPERHHPDGLVFVQADCRDDEALDEVAWVTRLAREDPRIRGIVAHAALERGAAVDGHLEALAAHPLVVGVRRLLQSAPAALAVAAPFVRGVAQLGALGLTFDACVTHTQLPAVTLLADACPATTIVLDHLGKPDVAGSLLEPWSADLAALAQRPNVVCKISGLVTGGGGTGWDIARLQPYVRHALSVFGPRRCLAGSDWPVLTLVGEYGAWFDALDALLEPLDADERHGVLAANALRVYGLAPGARGST
jgi:L-fuconolactonase